NTVPSEMRCNPSTRIPPTVNSAGPEESSACAATVASKAIVTSHFIPQYDREPTLRFARNCYRVLRKVTVCANGTLCRSRGNDTGRSDCLNDYTKTHPHRRRRSRSARAARGDAGTFGLSRDDGQSRRGPAARTRAHTHRTRV